MRGAEATMWTREALVVSLALILSTATATVAGARTASPSPGPEATQPFPPDDLATVLPQRIGRTDLVVLGDGVPDSEGPGLPSWTLFLARFGKDVGESRMAVALALANGLESDDVPLTVQAIRIDGVRATAWTEPFFDELLGDPGFEAPEDYVSGWRVIDGRDVYAVLLPPGPWPSCALQMTRCVCLTTRASGRIRSMRSSS